MQSKDDDKITCEKCTKFTKKGPNMGYCKYNGVMVLKFQTPCEAFKITTKPESAWSPSSPHIDSASV